MSMAAIDSYSDQVRAARRQTNAYVRAYVILICGVINAAADLCARRIVRLVLRARVRRYAVANVLVQGLVGRPVKVLLRVDALEFVPILIRCIAANVGGLVVVFMMIGILSAFGAAAQRIVGACREVRMVASQDDAIIPPLVRHVSVNVGDRFIVRRINDFTGVRVVLRRTVAFRRTLTMDVDVKGMDLRDLQARTRQRQISDDSAYFRRVIYVIKAAFSVATPAN